MIVPVPVLSLRKSSKQPFDFLCHPVKLLCVTTILDETTCTGHSEKDSSHNVEGEGPAEGEIGVLSHLTAEYHGGHDGEDSC